MWSLEHSTHTRVHLPLRVLQLVLPVAPPVALYGGRVQDGQLGLKFMRVKQNPWDTGAGACGGHSRKGCAFHVHSSSVPGRALQDPS